MSRASGPEIVTVSVSAHAEGCCRQRWQRLGIMRHRCSPAWPSIQVLDQPGDFIGTEARIDIESGTVQSLVANASGGMGGTWNRSGTILFASLVSGRIFRVSESAVSSPP